MQFEDEDYGEEEPVYERAYDDGSLQYGEGDQPLPFHQDNNGQAFDDGSLEFGDDGGQPDPVHQAFDDGSLQFGEGDQPLHQDNNGQAFDDGSLQF